MRNDYVLAGLYRYAFLSLPYANCCTAHTHLISPRCSQVFCVLTSTILPDGIHNSYPDSKAPDLPAIHAYLSTVIIDVP